MAPFELSNFWVFLKNFTITVYMKNFYHKNLLKYLIYYMDEMFFELLYITVILYFLYYLSLHSETFTEPTKTNWVVPSFSSSSFFFLSNPFNI